MFGRGLFLSVFVAEALPVGGPVFVVVVEGAIWIKGLRVNGEGVVMTGALVDSGMGVDLLYR